MLKYNNSTKMLFWMRVTFVKKLNIDVVFRNIVSGLLQYLQTSENLKSQPTEHLETISIIGYWKIVHIFHIFFQNYIIFHQVISSSVLAQSSLFHNNWREKDIKYPVTILIWDCRIIPSSNTWKWGWRWTFNDYPIHITATSQWILKF